MIKVGDVFGIQTKKGETYLQYIGKDQRGAVAVRVLSKFFDLPQDCLGEAIQQNTNFITFYPVNIAYRRKMVRKIGNFEVPEHSKKLPLFRGATSILDPKRIDGWIIPDQNGNKRSILFKDLTIEQKKMPTDGLINHDLLVSLIEEDWLPEKALW
jgi:hypothetical protein